MFIERVRFGFCSARNIEQARHRGHMAAVTVRRLLAMMIAVAMLFAPGAMPTGAMAAAPAPDRAHALASDHCSDKPVQHEDGGETEKSCCVAGCAAVAALSAQPAGPMAFNQRADRASLIHFIAGQFTELPTPPPRRA